MGINLGYKANPIFLKKYFKPSYYFHHYALLPLMGVVIFKLSLTAFNFFYFPLTRDVKYYKGWKFYHENYDQLIHWKAKKLYCPVKDAVYRQPNQPLYDLYMEMTKKQKELDKKFGKSKK